MTRDRHAAFLALFLIAMPLSASEGESPETGTGSVFAYERDKGLVFRQGATDLWFGLRGQLRYNNTATELDTEEEALIDESFKVNRARIKGGGVVGAPWLAAYGEYDLVGSKWLDYRATFTVSGWLDIRVGQWKSEFSRERINSSGKQQLVERSISNYWFTLDRQRGFSTSARFGEGTRFDSRFWIQALSGLGLNRGTERSKGLLMARWQWNPDGEVLPFSGSDLARRPDRVSSLAVAYVTGDSRCTRFSSDGCGQLPGFSDGDYDLEQVMLETAFQLRGLSWEQELHYKRIRDEQTREVTRLVGGYAQLGGFLNQWWPKVPAPLELVARLAIVDPNTDRSSDLNRELTLGANWFFSGHRNKLSLDLSWLEDDDLLDGGDQTRLRLQWEISL
jgi:phosphate-selective porin